MCWLSDRGLAPCEGVPMLLDTPNIVRGDDWSCGRVALAVMVGYHGTPAAEEYLDLANPVRGLSEETAEAVVRRLFPRVAVGHWGLDEVEHFTRRRRPVMVLVSNDLPADHWVVVRGIRGGRVYYHDTRGRASKPAAEFVRWWEGPAENDLRNYALCGWR